MNDPESSTVFFLRHGHADWPNWDGADDERPLTGKGRKETRKVARALKSARVKPALILTSPLPRAAETAKITGKRLGCCVVEEPLLGKGFDLEKFADILQAHPQPGADLMLVGHEPDFRACSKLSPAQLCAWKKAASRRWGSLRESRAAARSPGWFAQSC